MVMKSTFSHCTFKVCVLYPATDVVNNEVPLPTHYRSGCIQIPVGVCCYLRGQKYPPMSVCAEEIKLLSINTLVSINVGFFGGYDCARVRSRRDVHVLILLTRLVRTWSSCLDRIVTSSHLRSDWWKLPKTAKVILPISNCSNDWFR